MLKIKNASDYNILSDSIVTIGTFDGVHHGHQKIISRLTKIAKKDGLKAVVLTFFPHPRMVLQKDAGIKLINTIDEKANLLSDFGVDHLVIKEFTQEFSRLSALEYVRDVLVKKLHVKHIIIGYDHHFGRNRTANIDDLKEFGEIYDFKVTEITAQEVNEVAVSSTKIRKALIAGDIKAANQFLGYNFMLNGNVVKGKGLGKQINFPTANLNIEEDYKLIPKDGVYVVKANIENTEVFGMMNIGVNPTVDSSNTQSIEIHFFDFNNNIYDKNIKVEILQRLRDERKFASIKELKDQLQKDKQLAIEYINNA
ncbi:bifunctional riboflavin kinase/FAD synthetase [Pontimicrobium sp. IMCC45349]|uniref:bifunctional riboflavin kinase/FAD synthetase n=1 Tax=Pontimicrobium sp. IMCC45349 TaxID=3391574 RepID=UPI0039A2FC75